MFLLNIFSAKLIILLSPSIVLGILLCRVYREKRLLVEEKNNIDKELSRIGGLFESATGQIKEKNDQLKAANSKILETEKQKTQEETEKRALESLVEKFNETVTQAKNDLNLHFKTSAGDIFKEKSDEFSKNSQTKIQELLKPLTTNIDTFKTAVSGILKEHTADQGVLKGLIGPLNHQIANFTKALRGDFKVQGDFGEAILERLLELIGFKKGVHFTAQSHEDALIYDDGRKARPDFIVRLPENKKVIIDSKVSIKSAIDYFNADCQEDKEAAIGKHINSIKEHIKMLSNKQYPSVLGNESLDFTIMFVPNDHALLAALHNDDTLQSYALEKRIWLASPTLILPILCIIKDLWRINTINENVMEMSDRAGKIHTQVGNFLEKFNDIKTKLNAAIKSYEGADRTLQGKQGIVFYATTLEKLGAKTSKTLSPINEDASINSEESFESLDVSSGQPSSSCDEEVPF